MQNVNRLTILQLEWLEAVKYDQLLQVVKNYTSNPTSKNQDRWDQCISEYMTILSAYDEHLNE